MGVCCTANNFFHFLNRNEDCEIQLKNDLVSPKHLLLQTNNTIVKLIPLNSSAVVLNGFTLTLPTLLSNDDIIGIAGYTMRFEEYGIYLSFFSLFVNLLG